VTSWKASGTTAKRPIVEVYFPPATATMLAMTAAVKAMDSQRCVCRIQWFHLNRVSPQDGLERDRAQYTQPSSAAESDRPSQRKRGSSTRTSSLPTCRAHQRSRLPSMNSYRSGWSFCIRIIVRATRWPERWRAWPLSDSRAAILNSRFAVVRPSCRHAVRRKIGAIARGATLCTSHL
jgi:hypothetical protein